MENKLSKPPAPGVCPLCGQPNKCAVVADPNAKECWCESVVFPEELLDLVPEDAVRKACICLDCYNKFMASK